MVKQWPVVCGILLCVIVAYIPAMQGGFIWDDDAYVTENDTLRTVEGLVRIWFEPGSAPQYYPLLHTSFWVEFQLWGAHPFGYHLVNVILHALNAVLVWRVLAMLGVRGASLAGFIFALHPVHVESVAWITERKNVLSGFFYLSALWAYIRFVALDEKAPARSGRWRFYGWALGLQWCALLSKTVTATLPVIVLLLIWWKRGRLRWRDVVPTIPMFVIGAALSAVTVWMEMFNLGAIGRGAIGPEWDLSFVERCLVAGRATWFYTGKLLWPANLTFIYPRWAIDATVGWQYACPLAALGAIAALWGMRRRLGHGPLTAVLFFIVTLAPALGFFNVYPFRYSYVADHFQYLASLGLIAMFASLWTICLDRWIGNRRLIQPACQAVLLTVLGSLVWHHGHTYADLETLWLDTISKNSACWMAHNNLGNVYGRREEPERAIVHYRAAIRIKPDVDEPYYNMGMALAMLGRKTDAIEAWRATLRVNPSHALATRALRAALAEEPQE